MRGIRAYQNSVGAYDASSYGHTSHFRKPTWRAMQYRTAPKRQRRTKSRSLNTDGSGLSRNAAWANPRIFSVISGVSDARRKKFGSTPSRSATRSFNSEAALSVNAGLVALDAIT